MTRPSLPDLEEDHLMVEINADRRLLAAQISVAVYRLAYTDDIVIAENSLWACEPDSGNAEK